MQPGTACLEIETLLAFRVCSINTVDDSAVVVLASTLAGWLKKNNLTSLY